MDSNAEIDEVSREIYKRISDDAYERLVKFASGPNCTLGFGPEERKFPFSTDFILHFLHVRYDPPE